MSKNIFITIVITMLLFSCGETSTDETDEDTQHFRCDSTLTDILQTFENNKWENYQDCTLTDKRCVIGNDAIKSGCFPTNQKLCKENNTIYTEHNRKWSKNHCANSEKCTECNPRCIAEEQYCEKDGVQCTDSQSKVIDCQCNEIVTSDTCANEEKCTECNPRCILKSDYCGNSSKDPQYTCINDQLWHECTCNKIQSRQKCLAEYEGRCEINEGAVNCNYAPSDLCTEEGWTFCQDNRIFSCDHEQFVPAQNECEESCFQQNFHQATCGKNCNDNSTAECMPSDTKCTGEIIIGCTCKHWDYITIQECGHDAQFCITDQNRAACVTTSDELLGELFCYNASVYSTVKTSACLGTTCKEVVSDKRQKKCDSGCKDGQCIGECDPSCTSCILGQCVDEPGSIITIEYGSEKYDFANAIAFDSEGNYYIAGYTSRQLTSELTGFDALLIKFDKNGKLLWEKQWGTPEQDLANAILLYDDFVYISGRMKDDSTTNLVLSKFTKSGTLLWEKKWPSSTSLESVGKTLTHDTKGFIYAHSPYFILKTDSEGEGELLPVDTNNVIKFGISSSDRFFYVSSKNIIGEKDSNIKDIWAAPFSDGDITIYDMVVDLHENIYVTGYLLNAVQDKSSNDCVVIKLNSNGEILWKSFLGSRRSDFCRSISLDNDVLYIVGATKGNIENYSDPINLDGYNAFYAVFDSNGNELKRKQWDTPTHHTTTGALSPSGILYITGGTCSCVSNNCNIFITAIIP